ncbi:MAG: DNA gyrase inhibitor YacG [Planctomycetota bacterium]|nr:DNA gyrase inhibitor YacG [Planctomycetota bacterium]
MERAQARCSLCGKNVEPNAPSRPFCSDRCKMVDLGRWFRGQYAIPGEPAIALDPEEFEEHLRRLEARRAEERAEKGEHDDDA